MEVVLEGSACEEETVVAFEFAEAAGDDTVLVFELVSLINNDILPVELLESGHRNTDPFKSGQTDVKFSWVDSLLQDFFSLVLGRDQVAHSDFGKPFLELVLPVGDDRLRYDNQVEAFHFLVFAEEGDKTDGLDCFSQSLNTFEIKKELFTYHFIGQYSIDAGFIQPD